LEAFLADQDEVLVPPGDGGVPPSPGGRIAAPLRHVAEQQDAAGNGPPAPMRREIEVTRA
jgi:hypothetical protein